MSDLSDSVGHARPVIVTGERGVRARLSRAWQAVCQFDRKYLPWPGSVVQKAAGVAVLTTIVYTSTMGFSTHDPSGSVPRNPAISQGQDLRAAYPPTPASLPKSDMQDSQSSEKYHTADRPAD